jgi:2-dehydro-3-deoxygluconokinase
MPDILCMGEPMLELNQQPQPHSPGPDGRRLYLEGFGGDTSNAAIAAARSGASAGYITAVGKDPAGDAFLRLWTTEGVDSTTVLRRAEAPTGLYLVTHDAQGHHFSFHRSGSAASRMTPEEVPEAAIRSARVLHVSGISQAISTSACDAVFRAIEVARAAGVTVSYDTNLRLKLWPAARAAAVIHAALAMSDLAFPSIEDAQALSGLESPEAIAETYLKLTPMVLLKLGPEGVLLATRNAPPRRIPGFRVQAVDATGAGDTFAGAFLARHVEGVPPEEAARYACAAAALSTTGYGAVAPIPHRAAVEELLASAGPKNP